MKGMLATGARARPDAVNASPPLAERMVAPRRAPIHAIADAARLVRLPIRLLPIGLVAEDFALRPVQQVRQLLDVCARGVGHSQAVNDPPPIGADVHLHAEMPVVSLAGLLHLGIPRLARI